MRILRVLTATIAGLSLAIAGGSLANATPRDAEVEINVNQVKDLNVDSRYTELGQYLQEDVLDYNSALQNPQLDEEFLNQAAEGVLAIGGEVKMPETTKEMIEHESTIIDATHQIVSLRAACPGKNGFRTFWPTVYLDSCVADRIALLVSAGASATTLAAAIMAATGAGGAVAGVLAAALGLYGTGLSLCNWNHRGIKFMVNPINAIPLCFPQ